MSWEDKSDFEITMRVASKCVPDNWEVASRSSRADSELVLSYRNGPGCTRNVYLDYCNNPSDAWPIILENHINVSWCGNDGWFARTVHTAKVRDKNPLRAAMIVFLMMQGCLPE